MLERLEAEGLVEMRHGAGTFVAEALPLEVAPPEAPDREARDPRPPRSSELGARLLSLTADIEVREQRPFLPNTPAYDHFPFAIWQNCVSRQTRRAYRDNMGYAEPGRASSRCAGRSPAISRCTAVTPATRSRSSSRPARMRPS